MGHRVANGSPLLWYFFERSCVASRAATKGAERGDAPPQTKISHPKLLSMPPKLPLTLRHMVAFFCWRSTENLEKSRSKILVPQKEILLLLEMRSTVVAA